jgi:ubiquinone/menaquinone biosynthesis C-methylase UbiE
MGSMRGTQASDGGRGHPIFAAVYGWNARSLEDGPIGTLRRELLAGATGQVVDLGAGIGLNLPHLGPEVERVHLVEPDPHMIRRLERTLTSIGSDADQSVAGRAVVHRARAEALPLPDSEVDTVLATLTLCTVADVAATMTEIRRVLRPGGQVLVLEHVRSTSPRMAAWQDRLQRPWRWFGAGCNPNRDTGKALTAAGFDVSPLRRIAVRGLPMTPEWITGRVTTTR